MEKVLSPIDPLVNIASSIYSNNGPYALLVAFGLSRSAGIPTGWEVVIDRTRKLALASASNQIAAA